MTITLPACYYQQFDADYSLDVPGEGYGGWKTAELPLNLDKTAVVLMHATDYGTREQVPGVYAACEYIPRANAIGAEVMPALLAAVRGSPLRLVHMCSGEALCKNLPGYRADLAKPVSFAQVEQDEVSQTLRAFKTDHAFPGRHNLPSYEVYARLMKFPEHETPLPGEDIVCDEGQLLALCRLHGINHLIYIGYNINWCIQFANGGFLHLYRHGLLCSTVRGAVTAVENRETARANGGLEQALWMLSVGFGFVYPLEPFKAALAAVKGA